MHVSTLGVSNVAAYRALMLEAYEHAADAFTTTAAERRQEPEAWWIRRVGSATALASSFGVWADGKLVGSVAIEYSAKPKTRHAALVLGMYVTPACRGKGAGKSLMAALIEAAKARPEISILTLTLTEGNESALGLYRQFGFEVWGVEPCAIRTPSGFKGKVHMSLLLHRPTPRPTATAAPLAQVDLQRHAL